MTFFLGVLFAILGTSALVAFGMLIWKIKDIYPDYLPATHSQKCKAPALTHYLAYVGMAATFVFVYQGAEFLLSWVPPKMNYLWYEGGFTLTQAIAALYAALIGGALIDLISAIFRLRYKPR